MLGQNYKFELSRFSSILCIKTCPSSGFINTPKKYQTGIYAYIVAAHLSDELLEHIKVNFLDLEN